MTRTKATVKRRQQRRRVEREDDKTLLREAGLQPQAEKHVCEEARETTGNADVGVEDDRALLEEPNNAQDASRNGGQERLEELEDQADRDDCEAARESTGNGDVRVEEDLAPPAEPRNAEEAFSNGRQERPEEKEQEDNEEEDEAEDKAAKNDGEEGQLLLTDYEKQREQRLKENAAKLASLNLPSLASSLGPSRRPQRQVSVPKRKKDDDYVPSSSSDSQDSDGYDTLDDYDSRDAGRQIQQDTIGDLDEGQALEQAIALSLQTHADNVTDKMSKVPRPQRNRRQVSDKKGSTKKRRKGVQEQFTAEEIAAIFAIIDEQGKGKFSVAELERVVRSHDFTWSKQEIADMIDIFDSNKDGQLDLSEFQSIFGRMNMLRMHVT